MRGAKLRSIAVLVVFIVLLASGSAGAARMKITYTVDFEDGTSEGGWSFGNTFETIEPDGGNPGAYVRNDFLDTLAAQPRTAPGLDRSVFVGNYRTKRVTFVGIDLAVFSADSSTHGRPLSVILLDDGGSLNDSTDDCRVYRVGGHPTPMPNGTWKRYRFRIPSGSPTLPKHWSVLDCPGATEDEAWNRVITGVDQLSFFTGDPESLFIFQVWDVGLDNPTIIFEPRPVFDP